MVAFKAKIINILISINMLIYIWYIEPRVIYPLLSVKQGERRGVTIMESERADEINQHIAFIENIVSLWITLTPDDNIMGTVFLDVKDKLERIKFLNNEVCDKG